MFLLAQISFPYLLTWQMAHGQLDELVLCEAVFDLSLSTAPIHTHSYSLLRAPKYSTRDL